MIPQPYSLAVERLRNERRRIIEAMINSDGAPTTEQLQKVARLREVIEAVDAVLEGKDGESVSARLQGLASS